jgi:hypothetical protein
MPTLSQKTARATSSGRQITLAAHRHLVIVAEAVQALDLLVVLAVSDRVVFAPIAEDHLVLVVDATDCDIAVVLQKHAPEGLRAPEAEQADADVQDKSRWLPKPASPDGGLAVTRYSKGPHCSQVRRLFRPPRPRWWRSLVVRRVGGIGS